MKKEIILQTETLLNDYAKTTVVSQVTDLDKPGWNLSLPLYWACMI